MDGTDIDVANMNGDVALNGTVPSYPQYLESVMFKSWSSSLIVRGVLAFIVGIIAIVWPGPTALVLVIVVAAWAFVSGFAELFAAFQSRETAGTRAFFILAGLVSIAFGVVLATRPGVGAVTLALLFGLYSMIYGVSLTVLGIQARSTGKTLDSALPHAA